MCVCVICVWRKRERDMRLSASKVFLRAYPAAYLDDIVCESCYRSCITSLMARISGLNIIAL